MNIETMELEVLALFGEDAAIGTTKDGELVVYTGVQDEEWDG